MSNTEPDWIQMFGIEMTPLFKTKEEYEEFRRAFAADMKRAQAEGALQSLSAKEMADKKIAELEHDVQACHTRLSMVIRELNRQTNRVNRIAGRETRAEKICLILLEPTKLAQLLHKNYDPAAKNWVPMAKGIITDLLNMVPDENPEHFTSKST